MKKRVCLVSTGQPSTNPRLVKEADALIEAGYDVTVVAVYYISWADKADKKLLLNKKWTLINVGGFPENKKYLYNFTRIRHKLAKIFFKLGIRESMTHAAVTRTTPELIKHTKQVKADLYIAHNLGALPAVIAAAERNNAKVGFDAEDFHFEEQTRDLQRRLLVEMLEEKYLPACDYVTAASFPIAQAYAKKYGIPMPTAILNVFPLKFLQALKSSTLLNPGISLYWFSQTIGCGRGLEDVIKSMGKVKREVHLYLQGQVSIVYQQQLLGLAAENGVRADKIHFIDLCAPDDLFEMAAQYDIGLALEQNQPLNRDLCITNKIFTYLLAGLSVIATETQGQKSIIESIGRCGWMYKPGDIKALAARIEFLSDNKEELKNSKIEALKQAKERYNWDVEKKKYLEIIEQVI